MKTNELQDPLLLKPTEDNEAHQDSKSSHVKVKKHNPLLAITLSFVAMLFYAFAKLLSKVVFLWRPEMDAFQQLSIRMSISLIVYFIYLNKDIKRFLYDDIHLDQRGILIQKTVQGVITNFIFYYGISKVSLTEVSLINNTAPLLVAVLSYFLLDEGIKCGQTIALLLSFGGIVMLILGKEVQEDSAHHQTQAIALVLLIFGVSLSGLGYIYVRQLRYSHFMITPTYMHIMSLMIFLPIVYFENTTMALLQSLTLVEWLVLGLNGLITFFGSGIKALSLQYDTAGKLSILLYLDSAMQFVFDLFIIKTGFSLFELLGITIIFVTCIVNSYFSVNEKKQK